jgi:putative ABC transport system permease protein
MQNNLRELALLYAGIQLAWDAVRGHKMRSFLTVLGVIIGTGAIIGVGSILTGFDSAVSDAIKGFGTDTIIVTRWEAGVHFGNSSSEEEKRKPITYENARAIAERCPSVDSVGPYLFANWGIHRVKYKSNDVYQARIGGTTEGYVASGQADMKFGRFFSEFENQHRVPVVVIGEDVYKTLFATMDPSGKMIEVDGHSYQVLGVMNRPANSFPGQQDNRVMLPYWTMRKLNPGAKEHMLMVKAKPGLLPRAMDEVRGVLRQERRVKWNEPDNFGLSTPESMIENFRQVTSVTALVMVVLSSVGLLVGGIGVMNIMLVSVTERTKEIGIRKAVGARRLDIVIQFLTEAIVLTFSGGLFGMLLGWGISFAARLAFPSLPTTVPMWAALLGIGVSVGVGLFFGLWPATKAARLDPVDALRYE